MMRRALLVLCAAGVAYADGPPTPPALRLPAGVAPRRYDVELTVRPEAEAFTGRVTIEVEVAQPTPVVWLNAVGLDIDQADFDGRPASVVGSAPGFVGLAAAAPLAPGRAHVRIAYHGVAPDGAATGLFRVREAGDWYFLSKFESVFARKALPCFDEPGFKVPFQLTLHVAKALVARSNTPVVGETDEAGGMKAVRFAETRPLPTYLFALAVGPFDVVGAGRHGKRSTEIELLVPRGRRAAAGFAAAAAAALFERLESYFGVTYPYDKLDLIAAPQYPGAMENAALVLYGAVYLLLDPRTTSLGQRRRSASILAHETAHQWFGDLVTAAWWDDIWLNEAFATWLEAKIVDAWQPGFRTDFDRADRRALALAADATPAARQIRQPIASEDDIFNAFDGITYDKGAAVLAMFEAWVGADAFARGVRAYLEKHAFGNATSADFLAALGAASGRDVTRPFTTFLDQPGVPEVTMTVRCASTPTVELEQRRYLPVGSPAASTATWTVPICVRHPGGVACGLLDGAHGTLPLPLARSCPAWLWGNAGGFGYYLVVPDAAAVAKLGAALPELEPRERYGLTGDLTELALGGRLPVAQLLGLLGAVAADRDPQVALAAVRAADAIDGALVGPGTERAAWARWLGRTFGPRARALGWSSAPDEDDATRRLRGPLLELVAIAGRDAKLAADGSALARRWLDTGKGLDADLRGTALAVLVHGGDAAVLALLRAKLGESTDPEVKQQILRHLAHFASPAVLGQALALTVSELDPREMLQVMLGAGEGAPETAPALWAFVQQHLDALAPRVPPNYAATFIHQQARLCDRARAKEVAAFFKDRVAKVPGGPRALEQTAQRLEQCVVARAAQHASLAAALR
jgi:alanyl aminopeptidase